MRRPVGFLARDRAAGARIDARRHRTHGDALFHRTDADAQVAPDALGIDDFEVPRAVDRRGYRLVRRVLARDVTAPTLDAQVLVDERLVDVVEVQVLPVGDTRHGLAYQLTHAREALRIEIGVQAVDQVVDDLEPIDHRGRAHLHRARAQGQESDRVAPVGDATDARDRQVGGFA